MIQLPLSFAWDTQYPTSPTSLVREGRDNALKWPFFLAVSAFPTIRWPSKTEGSLNVPFTYLLLCVRRAILTL